MQPTTCYDYLIMLILLNFLCFFFTLSQYLPRSSNNISTYSWGPMDSLNVPRKFWKIKNNECCCKHLAKYRNFKCTVHESLRNVNVTPFVDNVTSYYLKIMVSRFQNKYPFANENETTYHLGI